MLGFKLHDDILKADSVTLLVFPDLITKRLAGWSCSQCFCGDWNTAGSSLTVLLHLLFCSLRATLPAHLALVPDVWFPAIRCLNAHTVPTTPPSLSDCSGSLLMKTYLRLCCTRREASLKILLLCSTFNLSGLAAVVGSRLESSCYFRLSHSEIHACIT